MPPRDANLLHRILFQHVAAAGGFEAARSLIGGLDPSVARRNVQALEEELGLILYERRPFRLTADGRHLIEFDRPLLEKLGQVSEHLKRKSGPRLRVGITGSAAKQFLFPTIAAWLAHPERAAIESCFGSMRELGGDLESGELDLLITTLAGDPPAGFASHHLATFRLVLIVPADSPVRSADEFWRPDAQLGCLIAPPADDAVMQTFEHGLERGGLHWPTRLTCDSPSSVANYVTAGHGIGLSLAADPLTPPTGLPVGRATSSEPGAPSPSPISQTPSPAALSRQPYLTPAGRGIRELPLPGFDPVAIAALWRPADSTRLKEPLQFLRGTEGEVSRENSVEN